MNMEDIYLSIYLSLFDRRKVSVWHWKISACL